MDNQIVERKLPMEVTNPREMLEEIEAARETWKKTYDDNLELQKYQEKNSNKLLLKWVLLIFPCFAVYGIIGEMIMNLNIHLPDAIFIIIFLGLLASCFILPALGYKKEKKSLETKISKLQGKIYDTLSATTSCIPPKHIYDASLNYMEDLVKASRVTNLAEALNKLEEQEHRWTVEGMHQQEIELLNGIFVSNIIRR